MYSIDGEPQEAVRQVRAAGHNAQLIEGNVDSIIVMRMETRDRPTTGEWETICVGFYDKWLNGEEVPADWAEAFELGDEDEQE